MKVLSMLPILTCVFTIGQGKIYERCELARKLKELGLDNFEGTRLADWVCIAEHESSFDSAAVHHNNPDSSSDYGIFQINSRYWCKDDKGPSSNICAIPCSELLSDNIAPSVTCAKTVLKESVDGLNAWVAWKKYCKDQDLAKYIEGCGVYRNNIPWRSG